MNRAAGIGCLLLPMLAVTSQVARALPDDAAPVAVVEIVAPALLAGLGIERRLLPTPPQTADQEQVRLSGAANLSEFLARAFTGVSVNDIAGSPFQTDLTYRGFRISPVLGAAQGMSVYLDGVRVNEPFGDVINWDMLPEAALSGVALMPGSNPLFGLNTLGGALVLTTKSGFSHPGFEADLTHSANGANRADLVQGWQGAYGWHALAALTLFDERGWRAHSNGRLANGLIKFGQRDEHDGWSIALLGGHSQLRGNGLLPDGLYARNRAAVYTYPDTTRNALGQMNLTMTHQINAGTVLSATAYARHSRRDSVNGDLSDDYADYASACAEGFDAAGAARDALACTLSRADGAVLAPASLNTSSTRQHGHGASANLSARRGSHHLNAGVTLDASRLSFAQFSQSAWFTDTREVRADAGAEVDARSAVDGHARALGIYLTDTAQIATATHLTASARWNQATVANTLRTGRGAASEQFVYRRLNPALGLVHQLDGGITLAASIANGNRVPTVIELGCADPAQPCRLPVALQSDPYLKQVRSRTVEAGLRWQGADSRAALTVYRTLNRDDILFVAAGLTQQGYFANVARTRHQGVELSGQTSVGTLSVQGSYHFLDATYDADGTLFTALRAVPLQRGTPMAGLARHTLKLQLDWQATPLLTGGLRAQAQSGQVVQGNEDGAGNWRIAGQALVHALVRWQIAPGTELSFKAGNLFNRRVESFGALATDYFPGGQLAAPHAPAPGAFPAPARFVAPGAGRTLSITLHYHY